MSDNIQVAIRVRQLIEKEYNEGLRSYWTVDSNTITEKQGNGNPGTTYTFGRVFDEQTITMDLYEDLCQPIIGSAVSGINGTIFAYGQSCSGKTFTMSGSKVQEGIISLAVNEIFSSINNCPDKEFLLRVAYLEIYNERVFDLLATDDSTVIKLHQLDNNSVQLTGLTEELVMNSEQVFQVVKRGDNKRRTAETKQNDRSSRSHCILRIIIESRLVGREDEAVMMSELNFVDLAGSEKAGENTGDRRREGCAINLSLFTLGNIIRKLSGDKNQAHASFRDSKLTRILQNALGGNSKTAVICTMTPAALEESHSTLRFASCAMTIQNKPVVNEVMSDAAMLKKYKREVQRLEKRISELGESDVQIEKAVLQKQLMEQKDQISHLKQMLVTAGGNLEQQPTRALKRRRETWCPGKKKLKADILPTIMEPAIDEAFDLAPLQNFKLNRTVAEQLPSSRAEEPPEPNQESERRVTFQTSPESDTEFNETIGTNKHIKELFEWQDKYEVLKESYVEKEKELMEIQEFTELERQMNNEMTEELRMKVEKFEKQLSDRESSNTWVEEELMKVQQERNSLRNQVETMKRQLRAVEDQSGITAISKQLSDAQSRVSSISDDRSIMESRYEFHLNQMKQKLEAYTQLLEEKGATPDELKRCLSGQATESSNFSSAANTDQIDELKVKHAKEIEELRDEVDKYIQRLEFETNRHEQDMAELSERLDQELDEQRKQFEIDTKDLREEVTMYQQTLEDFSKKEENAEEVKKQLEQLKKTLESQLEVHCQELETLRASHHDEIESLHAQYTQELDEVKDRYSQELASQQMQHTEEMEKLEKTQPSAPEVSSECQAAVNQIDGQSDVSPDKLSTQTKDLFILQQKLEELKEQYREKTEETEKYKEELEQQKNYYEQQLTEAKSKQMSLSVSFDQSQIAVVEPFGNNLRDEMLQAASKQQTDNDADETGKIVQEQTASLDMADNSEIVELKAELDAQKKHYEEEIAQLQSDLETYVDLLADKQEMDISLNSSGFTEKIKDMKLELESQRTMYEEKLEKLSQEHQSSMAVLKEQLKDQENKITELQIADENKQTAETANEKMETTEIHKADANDDHHEQTEKILELMEGKRCQEEQIAGLELEVETLTRRVQERENERGVSDMAPQQSSLSTELELAELRDEYSKALQMLDDERVMVTKLNSDIETYVELVDKQKKAEEEFTEKLSIQEKLLEKMSSEKEKILEDVALQQEEVFKKVVEDLKSENQTYSELVEEQKETIKSLSADLENSERKTEDEHVALELKSNREQVYLLEEENRVQKEKLSEMELKIMDLEKQQLCLTNQPSQASDELSILHQDTLKELEKQKQLYQTTLQELEEQNAKVTSLNSDIATYAKLIDEHENMKVILETEMENERKKAQEKVTELELEVSTLNKLQHSLESDSLTERDQQENKYQKAVEELEKQKEVCIETMKEFEECKAKMSSLKSETETYMELINEHEKLKNTLETELKAEQKKFEEQASELTSQREVFEQTVQDLKSENQTYSEVVEEQKDTIKCLSAEVENKDEQLQELMKAKQTAERDIETLKSEQEQKISEKEIEIKTYVELLENQDAASFAEQEKESQAIANLKNEMEQMRSSYEEKLSAAKSDLETYVDLLQEEMGKHNVSSVETDLESERKKVEDLTKSLESETAQKEKLEEVVTECQAQLQTVHQELEQLSRRINQMELEKETHKNIIQKSQTDGQVLRQELEKVTLQKLAAEEEMRKLMSDNAKQEGLEKLTKTQEELEKVISENLSLQQELEQQMSQNVSAQEELDKMTSEKLSLQQELEEQTSQNISTQEELEKVTSENLSLQQELEQRTSQNVSAQEELEKVTLENFSLQQELEQLTSRSVSVQQELEKLRSENLLTQQNLEKLTTENLSTQEELKKLTQENMSLQEDNFQLEHKLPPSAIKYHSLPENFDWEAKWIEFCGTEKFKRMNLYTQMKLLRKELEKEKERRENAHEIALAKVKAEERETTEYKELKELWEKAEDDANKLNDDLLNEKELTQKLQAQLKEAEEKAKKGAVSVDSDDHPCKYKLNEYSLKRQLTQSKEELQTRTKQFEETVLLYKEQIQQLKRNMRRIQNMDDTFVLPTDTMKGKPDVLEQTSHPSTSHGSIDLVDQYTVSMTESEIKQMKKELEVCKVRLSRQMQVEKDNKFLKGQLRNYIALHGRIPDDKQTTPRTPLEVVVETAKTSEAQPDVSAKKEPKFKLSDLPEQDIHNKAAAHGNLEQCKQQ